MLAEQPLLYYGGRPFNRRFAIAHGWSDRKLAGLARDGTIRRLVKGVYVDALVPDTIELRAAAVALVAPKDAVICRQTAAWIYGIDALALRTTDDPPAIECVQPPRRRASRLTISRGHSQTLLPGDVVEIAGLRLTSRLATAVHLARHLDRPFALSAIDSMLHSGFVAAPELRAAAAKYPHHPGIVQAREMIRFAEPLTESPGESWLRLRLMDAGFGRPSAQIPVKSRHRNYRIDLGYPTRGTLSIAGACDRRLVGDRATSAPSVVMTVNVQGGGPRGQKGTNERVRGLACFGSVRAGRIRRCDAGVRSCPLAHGCSHPTARCRMRW